MPTRRHASTHWGTELDTSQPTRVSSLIRGAVRLLDEAGIPAAEADAMSLLAHAWGIDRPTLNRRRLFDDPVPAETTSAFAELCERRRQRIPLQHLTGTAHFRRLELQVGPGVFVPRPETELIVGAALDELAEHHGPDRPCVLDLCSGSGAITLAIATEHNGAEVIGIEREPDALEWARKNLDGTCLGDSRVDLIEADATKITQTHPHLIGRADVVVTNPPYVPDAAIPRDPEVAEHDPAGALYGGSTGLEIPALIIGQAEHLLRPGGLFLMEHGEEQGPGARDLLEGSASLRQAETYPDYTGRDRYTVARRAETHSG